MKLLVSVVQEVSPAVSHAPSQSRLGLGRCGLGRQGWWTLGASVGGDGQSVVRHTAAPIDALRNLFERPVDAHCASGRAVRSGFGGGLDFGAACGASILWRHCGENDAALPSVLLRRGY